MAEWQNDKNKVKKLSLIRLKNFCVKKRGFERGKIGRSPKKLVLDGVVLPQIKFSPNKKK
jgi:hypothetical protein